MERLEVEFTGDVKQLNKATDDAIKELKNFDKQANKSLDFDKPSKKAVKGFRNIKTATANANPTLQEFSRVIQDAPFGIQGVGNNITQLVSNFGNLSRATGGSVGALKALASSFLGPGGILFAVSTVVSLLTVYGDELFKTKNDTQKLVEANKAAAKAIDDYIESLTGLNKALSEGSRNAAKEVSQLQLLRSAAEDTARSTNDRKKAVQELKRLFPSYFRDIKDEKILNGELAGTYDLVSDSIIKRAQATAASNLIVKNTEKELVLLRQIADTRKEIDDIKAKPLFSQTGGGSQQQGVSNALRAQAGFLERVVDEANDRIQDLRQANKEILDEINKLGGIDLSNVKLNTSSLKPDAFSLPKEFLIKQLINSGKEGEKIANAFQEGVLKGFNDDAFFKNQQLLSKLLTFGIIKGLTDAELIAIQKAKEFTDSFNQILVGGIENSIASIGSSIGDALSNGGSAIEKIGQGLLGSLGSVIVQLGKLAIVTGLGMEGIKKSLGTFSGVGAIAAGAALVAIGSAFTAKARGIGSSLGSGGSSGVSSGGPTTRNSTITTSGGGFGDGTVVFEIAGTKLVGVLNRTLNRNLAIGG